MNLLNRLWTRNGLTTSQRATHTYVVGQSGTAYNSGISIIWLAWTGSMALVIAGLFVMPILRRLAIRTVPEFLEIRYNWVLRTLVTVIWMFRLSGS